MDKEEALIEVSTLYSGNKSFWRTGQTLDITMFEHKTILNGNNPNPDRVIEVICYDPEMSKEFSHIYLSYTILFSKVSNITTTKGMKVAEGSKYTQSLLSKHIYSRIGFSNNDSADFGWNFFNNKRDPPEVVLLPFVYDITLNGRLDIELQEPLSGLGALPIIIRQQKIKNDAWLKGMEAFKKDVEATETLVTIAEKASTAMKIPSLPIINSDNRIPGALFTNLSLSLIAAVSTAESGENEDKVGSLTPFPLTGISDQDSDKNPIIPTVIDPFPAPK